MKRILILLLALMLCFAAVACNVTPKDSDSDTETETVTDTGTETTVDTSIQVEYDSEREAKDNEFPFENIRINRSGYDIIAAGKYYGNDFDNIKYYGSYYRIIEPSRMPTLSLSSRKRLFK